MHVMQPTFASSSAPDACCDWACDKQWRQRHGRTRRHYSTSLLRLDSPPPQTRLCSPSGMSYATPAIGPATPASTTCESDSACPRAQCSLAARRAPATTVVTHSIASLPPLHHQAVRLSAPPSHHPRPVRHLTTTTTTKAQVPRRGRAPHASSTCRVQ